MIIFFLRWGVMSFLFVSLLVTINLFLHDPGLLGNILTGSSLQAWDGAISLVSTVTGKATTSSQGIGSLIPVIVAAIVMGLAFHFQPKNVVVGKEGNET